MNGNRKIKHNIIGFTLLLITALLVLAVPASVCSGLGTPESAAIEKLLSAMSIDEKIGQLVMTDLTAINKYGGPEKAAKELHIGSYLLFSADMPDVESTVKLTDRLCKLTPGIPPLIATEQEGGRAVRLTDGTAMPGNMALGACRSMDDAQKAAKVIGEELYACGINVDLAPVLDVISGPEDPGMGTRSFSSDPELVASLGRAFIKGLQESGVAAAAKHFPGQGRASVNTYLSMPVVPGDFNSLESTDLLPFIKAISEKTDILMTAHVAYPDLDSTRVATKYKDVKTYLPATLSHRILTDMCRNKLQYNGVIMTDAIDMKAITLYFGSVENAFLKAIDAGADIVLTQSNPAVCLKKLKEAVKSNKVQVSRIDASIRRILRMKVERGLLKLKNGRLVPAGYAALSLKDKLKLASSVVGSAEHKTIERELTEKAVTLVRNSKELPFKLAKKDSLVFFAPTSASYDICKKALDAVYAGKPGKKPSIAGVNYESKTAPDENDMKKIQQASHVLLFTYSSSTITRDPARYDKAGYASMLAAYVQGEARHFAAVALGDPYDISYMPDIQTYVAVYGTRNGLGIEASIKAVLGLIGFKGILPVVLEGE